MKKVLCDHCDRDITSTGNSVDYRILLANESLPAHSSFVTDKMIYPPIKGGDKHFCGTGCLKAWIWENKI